MGNYFLFLFLFFFNKFIWRNLKVWNSGSSSSGRAIGKEFIKKLLYVQHVDKEKDTASETSEQILEEYLLAHRTNFYDSNFTEYLKSSKENLSILKSSMKDEITEVRVYSNPLPIPLQLKDVTIHAFIVFTTENYSTGQLKRTWWSLEKNGHHIVLQQSTNEDDVIKKIYDTEKKTSVKRHGKVTEKMENGEIECSRGRLKGRILCQGIKFLYYMPTMIDVNYDTRVEDLLQVIWDTNQISELYNLLTSNCQHFTSLIFEELTGEKWSTAKVNRKQSQFKIKKIRPRIQLDAFKYKSILNDKKFDFYRAMMEGRREDFEELINDLTIECLNDVDSQGYTLLEWGTVFSSFNWPIDEELKEKGVEIPSDERSFRRNVFFIALQYLPLNQKSKLFESFDEIDINAVNPTGDTSLHLALNGEEWEIAVKILKKFEKYDVNRTNSIGDTPLLLAARLNCKDKLFTKILERTNQENINKADGNGWTAFHYAIVNKSKTKVEELLKHKDVDVDVKNSNNDTPLHFASWWTDIPSDLFKEILEKSNNINAQDKDGETALHLAISVESEIAINEFLKRKIQTSKDVAKGRQKLLYVQHVDKDKDMTSETSNRYLEEYLQSDRTDFIHDSNFTEYLASPKENLSILKSSMGDEIVVIEVYLSSHTKFDFELSLYANHAFVVFMTKNRKNFKETWWSVEKNRQQIVLQQSQNEDDVMNKIYDTEKRRSVERLGPIQKQQKSYSASFQSVKNLFQVICYNNQIGDHYYHLFFNCQDFASFIYEHLTGKMCTFLWDPRTILKDEFVFFMSRFPFIRFFFLFSFLFFFLSFD